MFEPRFKGDKPDRSMNEAQKRASKENWEIFRLRGHIALCHNLAYTHPTLGLVTRRYVVQLETEICKIKRVQLIRKNR